MAALSVPMAVAAAGPQAPCVSQADDHIEAAVARLRQEQRQQMQSNAEVALAQLRSRVAMARASGAAVADAPGIKAER